jgi:hypothetical protein
MLKGPRQCLVGEELFVDISTLSKGAEPGLRVQERLSNLRHLLLMPRVLINCLYGFLLIVLKILYLPHVELYIRVEKFVK